MWPTFPLHEGYRKYTGLHNQTKWNRAQFASKGISTPKLEEGFPLFSLISAHPQKFEQDKQPLPTPSTRVKRVNVFLSQGAGPISIWDHQSDCKRSQSYFEPNWKFVLPPVFLAVPIDLAAIFKWGCVGVHMHRGIRHTSTGFKAATMKDFTTYGFAPCDKKCHLAHKTFFHFLGTVWKRMRLPENISIQSQSGNETNGHPDEIYPCCACTCKVHTWVQPYMQRPPYLSTIHWMCHPPRWGDKSIFSWNITETQSWEIWSCQDLCKQPGKPVYYPYW